MTGLVRNALAEMAQRAPSLPMPGGIYDRARKRQRRQRILGAIGAVAVLAAGAGVVWTVARPGPVVNPSQVNGIDDMPARVDKTPMWTASIEDAPMPRALVAFAESPDGDITLVGPGDRYRVYEADRTRVFSTANDLARPVLSPDGRFLMTGRGLLDVTTGVTRPLGTDMPLGFSPDSRLALLARYDSDIQERGEVRAVDPVTGEFVWAIKLEPGPLPRDVGVAVAPDGSLVAIKRHGDLWLYDETGRLLWKQSMNGELAGSKAFVLERRSVALSNPGRLCLYDTEKGDGGVCYDLSQFVSTAGGGPPEIVGWDGAWPIVNLARGVVSAQGADGELFQGPEQLDFLGFASERVRWSKRQPGPPDAGPFLARLHAVVSATGVRVAAGVVVVVLLIVVRLRAKRARNRGIPRDR